MGTRPHTSAPIHRARAWAPPGARAPGPWGLPTTGRHWPTSAARRRLLGSGLLRLLSDRREGTPPALRPSVQREGLGCRRTSFLSQILWGSGADGQDQWGGVTAGHVCLQRGTGSKHSSALPQGPGPWLTADPGTDLARGGERCPAMGAACAKAVRLETAARGGGGSSLQILQGQARLTSHIKGPGLCPMGSWLPGVRQGWAWPEST